MASKLAKMMECVTETDLEEIEAEIAKDTEALDKKKNIRNTIMALLGMPVTPNRVQSGGSVASRHRDKILEYLSCTDEPISGYRICTDCEIPTGSQTFVLNHEWFERKDKGYVLSDAGREAAGVERNGYASNGHAV